MKANREYKSTPAGRIPSHWHVVPLKHFVRINTAVLSEDTNLQHELFYLDISAVSEQGLREQPKRMTFENAPSRARRIVHSGDTLISTVRTYLRAIAFIETADKDLIASTGFAVLTPQEPHSPKFISYLVRNEKFISMVTAESKGVNYPAITDTELGRFPVAFPTNRAEQDAIVSFLEMKEREIAAFIKNKRHTIELLKEHKTALINRAVMARSKPIWPSSCQPTNPR